MLRARSADHRTAIEVVARAAHLSLGDLEGATYALSPNARRADALKSHKHAPVIRPKHTAFSPSRRNASCVAGYGRTRAQRRNLTRTARAREERAKLSKRASHHLSRTTHTHTTHTTLFHLDHLRAWESQSSSLLLVNSRRRCCHNCGSRVSPLARRAATIDRSAARESRHPLHLAAKVRDLHQELQQHACELEKFIGWKAIQTSSAL